MATPVETLTTCSSKLWLDSGDPEFVRENRAYGTTGATSNPIIIADLIRTGRFDQPLNELIRQGRDDEAVT